MRQNRATMTSGYELERSVIAQNGMYQVAANEIL